MTPWICPAASEFVLLNDPDTYRYGQSFKLVIDFCDSTSSPTCVTDEQKRADFLKLITVQSKVVSQYFSADTYKETGQLTYSSFEQMNSGLVANICTVKGFNVFKHQLKVFDSKAYDLSALTSFDLSEKFDRYSFFYWNTSPKPYVRIPGDKDESTGIFQLAFVQNRKIYKETLAIYSIDGVIALLGGYMNIVFLF